MEGEDLDGGGGGSKEGEGIKKEGAGEEERGDLANVAEGWGRGSP